MGIEIRAIGGYGEIGKNMTAVKVDDDVVIIDMGLHLPNWIHLTADEAFGQFSPQQMINAQAIPDDSTLSDWKDKVLAIIPSHAHLDHIGAIPYLATKYNAPVMSAPFTIEVIKRIITDEKIRFPNKLISVKMNTKIKLSEHITLQMVEITHSTPHSCLVVLHTPYGAVIYANDFKLDNNPTLGNKPDYKLLEQLGNEGVAVLISECLYAPEDGKTPSESVARAMLQEVMLDVDNKNKGVIVTTFSSHIARLRSIVDFSAKLNRKCIFLGRSIAKYTEAAVACGITDFSGVLIAKYPKQVARTLRDIERKREKYVMVATGHQGEPNSVLHRIIHHKLPYHFKPDDHIIFSCNVIPTTINQQNRDAMEEDLRRQGMRIFKDIHASGHARKEDLREFLNLLRPQHVIPSHGGRHMMQGFERLGDELKYTLDETLHPMNNGETLRLN